MHLVYIYIYIYIYIEASWKNEVIEYAYFDPACYVLNLSIIT